MNQPVLAESTRIAFVGGGNMASAIIGGLIRQGLPAARIVVVDPFDGARAALKQRYDIDALAAAGAELGGCDLVVWAVKPQGFGAAAAPVTPYIGDALQLSIMAGIRVGDMARATGHARIVRCMPNTPALIGRGITAMFAAHGVRAPGRALAEAVVATVGEWLWVEREAQLDAVTALSGSGPAYVFYFLEAMQQAGTEMGLSAGQARQLAVATFAGGSALAAQSDEPLATLRERVTSKGGTTYAALTFMAQAGVQAAFVRAMHAAFERARQLGDEFGSSALSFGPKGLALLKQIEGLRLQPYDDQTGQPVTHWVAGATIGCGHLIDQAHWARYAGGISEAAAQALLEQDLAPFVDAVRDAIHVDLAQHQFDALVIFAFNIGIRAFKRSSVVKIINDPDVKTSYPSLEAAWKAWDKSQGKVNQGLVHRRAAEWGVYANGTYPT